MKYASLRAFSSSTDAVVTFQNGVKTITFNRPTKLNSLTEDMYRTIIATMKESNTDENTKLLVLTGTGDFYTSGTDVARFRNIENPKKLAEESAQMFMEYVTTFIDFKKPIIALINGHSVGIGTTTLGLTDIVYASDKATFSTPFSTLGLVPEGCSSYTFPRIMGYAKANEMLIFNQRLNAEEGHKCGLVTRVFPHNKFYDETSKLINEMAKLPLKSLVFSKDLVRGRERELLHKVNQAENDRLVERWQSEEFFSAIKKFFAKLAK